MSTHSDAKQRLVDAEILSADDHVMVIDFDFGVQIKALSSQANYFLSSEGTLYELPTACPSAKQFVTQLPTNQDRAPFLLREGV